MDKIKSIILIILLILVAIAGLRAVKRSAPDFSLFDSNGQVFRLSRIARTNIVILNFFGTWCPPCRKEIPDFVKVSKEYQGKNIQFLGILVERQYNMKKIKKFIKNNEIPYPILMSTREVVQDYKIRAYPTTFIIDKGGYIIKKKIGMMDEKKLKEFINNILNREEKKEEKNVETTTTTNKGKEE